MNIMQLSIWRDNTSEPAFQIFVISLARSPERRENVRNQLGNIPHVIVDAVDGKAMTRGQEKLANRMISRETINSDGSIGCFLSHYFLWKHIVEHNIDYALILEDDIVVRRPFVSHVNKLIQAVPDCDLIYIGHCLDTRSGHRVAVVDDLNLYKTVESLCTHAYVVSQKGASKLIQYIENYVSFDTIDKRMLTAVREGILTAYSVQPKIIGQNGMTSTIGEYAIIDSFVNN
jgi:GR25 family glycosyltransferase involved in LPS biosynthesis